MAKCSFCKHDIAPGTGTMLIKNDGKMLYFCSSKCDKNFNKLKREPRNTRWTKSYHEQKEAEKQ